MIISIFESIAYGQVFNVSSIWIQQHVALDLGGFRIPVPWFQSINSVFSIAERAAALLDLAAAGIARSRA